MSAGTYLPSITSSLTQPVYDAALLLHPRRRKSYIVQNWLEDWLESTIRAVERLWASYKDRKLPNAKLAVSIDQDRPLDEYDCKAT
jgi:hypothetical protein